MASMEGDSLDEARLNQLRNLKMFKGKTDDEIRDFFANKPKPPEEDEDEALNPDIIDDDEIQRRYKIKYTKKLKALQKEYGVDMNNSNDAELLKSLVRHIIQAETLDNQIQRAQASLNMDPRLLKSLGDVQRTTTTSIMDLQEKLGITRKTRKEKQVDDVAAYIDNLRVKASKFWEEKTVSIRCYNCHIELARYWLNFPANVDLLQFEGKCWKCQEKIIYKK